MINFIFTAAYFCWLWYEMGTQGAPAWATPVMCGITWVALDIAIMRDKK